MKASVARCLLCALKKRLESVPPEPSPVVTITNPPDMSGFQAGLNVNFTGTSLDVEDGDLSAGIMWSSDLDGALGTGASINVTTLSIGTHTITASSTDSDTLTGTDTISVTIIL